VLLWIGGILAAWRDDAVSLKLLQKVLTKEDDFLSAEPDAAGIGGELCRRELVLELFRDGLGQGWAGNDGPWAWVIWTGNKDKPRVFGQGREMKNDVEQGIETLWRGREGE